MTACVLLVFAIGCNRALTQKTADKLIPNGMSEAQVYEMLGTNGVVSFATNGEKWVTYFFPFTGQPLKTKTDLVAMTVVFSNGVVIGRSFPKVQ